MILKYFFTSALHSLLLMGISHLRSCSDLNRNHVLVVVFSITKIGPINPGLKVDQVLSSTSSDLPEKALRSHTLDNPNSSGKFTSTSSVKRLRTNNTCLCMIAYLAAASGKNISSLFPPLFLLNPAPFPSFTEKNCLWGCLASQKGVG